MTWRYQQRNHRRGIAVEAFLPLHVLLYATVTNSFIGVTFHAST